MALLTAIILIFVAGFRWRVGTDYWTYSSLYSTYKTEVLTSIKTFDEPGIRVVSYVSSLIYDDYAMMFLISSIITIGLFVWTYYRYSDAFFISILLYIFGHGWTGSFNGVRQYIASAILFSGHKYILEKKIWKYLLIVFLASLFHISAAPMILLYFVPQANINKKRIIILLIMTIILFFSYDAIFQVINEVFISLGRETIVGNGAYSTQNINPLRILVMIAPAFLYYFITPKSRLNSKDFFYINMIIINATIFLISINSAYLARFALYTTPYIPIGFPIIFKGVNKKITLNILYFSLVLYLFYWGYDVMITPNLRNFQWIFER